MAKWQNYNTRRHIDHSSWNILYSGLNVDPILTLGSRQQHLICSGSSAAGRGLSLICQLTTKTERTVKMGRIECPMVFIPSGYRDITTWLLSVQKSTDGYMWLINKRLVVRLYRAVSVYIARDNRIGGWRRRWCSIRALLNSTSHHNKDRQLYYTSLETEKTRQNRLKTIKLKAKECRPYTCSFSFQDKNSEMPKKGIRES